MLDFQQMMQDEGYESAEIQIFNEVRTLDYLDDDGDSWEFQAWGVAMQPGQRKFHVFSSVGLVANIEGNQIKFSDGKKICAEIDLGAMDKHDPPHLPSQRYMRALCEGDEAALIEPVKERLLWRARTELLHELAQQCMCHTLRFGTEGEKVLAVLHNRSSHTMCSVVAQHGVEPLTSGELADPGGFYQVYVATTPGMTAKRAEALLLQGVVERYFGPAPSDETFASHDHPGHIH